ncbi:MAG: hypothetical protein HYX94_04755 [Chloroflexi bacterium]|nr:hypothetical protein [Chloroflexota bacterium]
MPRPVVGPGRLAPTPGIDATPAGPVKPDQRPYVCRSGSQWFRVEDDTEGGIVDEDKDESAGFTLLHALLVLLLLWEGMGGLPQSSVEASTQPEPKQDGWQLSRQDASLFKRLAEARLGPPEGRSGTPRQASVSTGDGAAGQAPASEPPQAKAINPPVQSPAAQAVATPTPSGATSPVPLNHNFDAPSVDLPSLGLPDFLAALLDRREPMGRAEC